jgi:transposase-like protein
MSARPYQLLPPLDEEQRHLLRQSIQKSGVLEPVVFDEDGEILDGHHRVEIAEELDIDYPRRVVADLDEEGKRRYAITTNVARRQLSPTVRSSLVAQLRMQGLSVRKIAEETGLPKSTVSDDIRQLSDAGQLDQPERITGADGRERPSTRPTQSPGPADPTTSPADPGAAPAPASPSLPAPAREPDPTPEPAAAPSTALAGPGSGEEAALREGSAASRPDQDEVDLQTWRLNFSKALTAAFRVPLFDPAHVAEKADAEHLDQLRRLRASIEDYANRVDAALAASMPDNVRQIRRNS